MFATNEGTVDRALRIVAGLAILSLFFIYPDASWRYFALIGIVPWHLHLPGEETLRMQKGRNSLFRPFLAFIKVIFF
jgi:hypothetical protein